MRVKVEWEINRWSTEDYAGQSLILPDARAAVVIASLLNSPVAVERAWNGTPRVPRNVRMGAVP